MGSLTNKYEFTDGYAIDCKTTFFKAGWDSWSEEKYNIINEKYVKQFENDCDKIELLSSKTNKYYRVQNNDKVGLLSSKLEEILPYEYFHVELNKNSDIFIAVKKDGLRGYLVEYIKNDGKIIRSIICLETLYDRSINKDLFPPFTDKYCVVTNNSNKGILDLDGRYIVPPVYEKLEIVDENRIIACLDSKFGIINFNESILVDFIYDRMKFVEENYFLVQKNNFRGVLNLLYPEKLKLKEIYYHEFSEGTVIVSKQRDNEEEIFGVEDYAGNELIPFIYDEISKFENGIAIVSVNYKHGLINKNNQFIQPLKDSSVERIEKGYFLTKWKNKYGLLNPDGSFLLKQHYSKIEFLKSCFRIKNYDFYNYLNFNGEFEYDEWKQEYGEGETYSQRELDNMYRDAFDGFADAVWNVD